MKLVTLNTWGGLAGKDQLLDFFKQYDADTDIFCLQEIWAAPHHQYEGQLAGGKPINNDRTMVYALNEISARLSNFRKYFRPLLGDHYGLAIFIKNGVEIKEEGEVYVYQTKGYVGTQDIGDHARSIQYLLFEKSDRKYCVVNFHGLWNGGGKIDSPDRIKQSQIIADFLSTKKEYKIILAGDFNLLPTTESLKLIEGSGLKNLITVFGITSTRTSHYKKPEKYADYIFVSPNVKVNEFKVMPEEVSDHSPLYLDFE